MTEEDLAALGRECAENDSRIGITGMLLHKNGNFLQAIKGSKGVVGDMYARIVADPRHTNVLVIRDCTIALREFEGQTMGFKNLDGAGKDTPFLNPFSYEAFAGDPALAMLMLSYFFRNQ